MDRSIRRMLLLRGRRDTAVSEERRFDEAAVRGRTARKVRSSLRRLDPVALVTPRWSAPQAFLEDVALDLAVGGNGPGCRTVSLRPVEGRSVPDAWNFCLRMLAGLAGPAWSMRPMPIVADRRGFVHVAAALLEAAHENAQEPMALLAHGVHHLPVEVLEDLSHALSEYLRCVGDARRVTVLLAGAVETPTLSVHGAVPVALTDFAEAEAQASVLTAAGPVAPEALARAVRFTGGVPALVNAVTAGVLQHGGIPRDDRELLGFMGGHVTDLRDAVGLALTVPAHAERLHLLLDGAPRTEEPALDGPLRTAGLVRGVRAPGPAQVQLRAPAIAALCVA
jgi:hypothetical protein